MNDFLQIALPMLAVSLGAVFLRRMFSNTQDPREPPLVSAPIPFIGHLIGVMRSKFKYCVQLSQQNALPIFTINMLGSKMYIVTSLDLIHAIQRQPKTLSFPPIGARFASKILGTSDEAHRIMMNNVNGAEGDWGLSAELYAATRKTILSIPEIDKMSRAVIQSIAASFDRLDLSTDKAKLKLADWVWTNITIATTDSVYGPQNPFKDESVADAFWQFESNLMSTHIGILPSITARKAMAGRTKVAEAFEHYFRTNGHRKATANVQSRYEVCIRNKVSNEDIARYEVGGSIAILINTVPAGFWTLLLVYSYPGLLDDIRKELDSVVTKTFDNGLVRKLDINLLKSNCHLLTSTVQEVLRYRSMSTSVRKVMEDTVLSGQWLLKKDCMIQIPNLAIHTDSTIWGIDAGEFNPRRFMKEEGQKARPAAFRAFGGGTTLCPGRHFATNEVLALVSMFVLRFEMTPTEGKWSLPKTDNSNLGGGVMQPDTDVEVEISTRKGFDDGRWIYELKDLEPVFAMVAEDHAPS